VTSDLFERAERFALPDELRAADLIPFYLEFTDLEATRAKIGGRSVLMMGGLDYLGLSADPRVRQAAASAALGAGTSRTGSRLHCGSTPEQRAFETLIASFLGREDALVFASGYMAQSGLITALMDTDALLVLDERAHASILDGALVARCRVRRFAHNDPASLEQQLARGAGSATLVMVESLYSNEGDLAPLPEIRAICTRYGARLAVDEAHGLGVLGAAGRGLEEHFAMPGAIDVISGTFSKSLASVGGWIAGSRKVVDWIRFHGRPILFSAAISPASLAAAHRSLEILIAEPDLVARLQANSRRWRSLLIGAGVPLVKDPAGPLASVRIGDEKTCLIFSRRLLEAGVYANTVLHPSVPRGEAVIRTVVSSAHQESELTYAAEVFARLCHDLKVNGSVEPS
jgi:7-keto-8-aminopelargonate synthetase-like enzyme